MKITLSWLNEYLHLDDPQRCIKAFESIGLEVEHCLELKQAFGSFRVAQVVDAKKHPHADRLSICRVYDGHKTLEIVCGAPNVRKGLKSVLAPVGAQLPFSGQMIEEVTIRGQRSEGMLCSECELGLSGEHSKILELPAHAVVGHDLFSCLPLETQIVDLGILPNLSHCLSIRGIAREIAPYLSSASFSDKRNEKAAIEKEGFVHHPFTPKIAQKGFCESVHYILLEDIDNTVQLPDFIRYRLQLVGKHSVSPVVDILNYCTHEFGQPMHAYDASTIVGSDIIVDTLRDEGSAFHALNGERYFLPRDAGVIVDVSGKILGLAGVIGSDETKCQARTTRILLEAGIFSSHEIVAVMRRMNLTTDAGYRFEHGVDANEADKALCYAAALIQKICGGRSSRVMTAGDLPVQAEPLRLKKSYLQKISGLSFDDLTVTTLLQKVGILCVPSEDDSYCCTIPSWRRGDVTQPIDLVEEVLRAHGYQSIPVPTMTPLLQSKVSRQTVIHPEQKSEYQMRFLLAGRGYHEVRTWSFTSRSKAELFADPQTLLKVSNPLSQEMDTMRPTPLINLLDAVHRNHRRNFENISLFELGLSYLNSHPQDGTSQLFVAVKTGDVWPRNPHYPSRAIDFFDCKADLEFLLRSVLPFAQIRYTPEGLPPYYHPGKSAMVHLVDHENRLQTVGSIGALHPAFYQSFQLPSALNVWMFEGSLEALEAFKLNTKVSDKVVRAAYTHLPVVVRDFAFIIDSSVEAFAVEQAVSAIEMEHCLKKCYIFDAYQSAEHQKSGKKSVAFSVELHPTRQTLHDAQITGFSERVIACVQKNFNGILRDGISAR